eukprot:g23525.t1
MDVLAENFGTESLNFLLQKAKGHREERLAALLVLRQFAGSLLASGIVEGVQPLLSDTDAAVGCLAERLTCEALYRFTTQEDPQGSQKKDESQVNRATEEATARAREAEERQRLLSEELAVLQERNVTASSRAERVQKGSSTSWFDACKNAPFCHALARHSFGMTSKVPLLNKRNRKATVVKAAWQLENAIVGKFLENCCDRWSCPFSASVRGEDVQAARLLHYDCMRFNKWYYRALLALVLLTLFEVPAWCHQTQNKDMWETSWDAWTWYPGYELCIVPVEGGDPFLSGVWYVPPGYALIIEIGIEIIVSHFVPAGVTFQNTRVIFYGSLLAVGSIIDTALFTVFRVPFRASTGFAVHPPRCSEFMSISVFLWGTMLFFAWISVTTLGSWHAVAYKEEGEPVYVNKDIETLPAAFYSMFVAAVTGDTESFLRVDPVAMVYRVGGLLLLICGLAGAETNDDCAMTQLRKVNEHHEVKLDEKTNDTSQSAQTHLGPEFGEQR